MQKIRLLNQPEDYKRLGVNPGPVKIWEDGRRDDDRSGAMERCIRMSHSANWKKCDVQRKSVTYILQKTG